MDNIVEKHFHFIAIGGVGMSALAKYLYERGAEVSGSDISESKYTHKLQDIGVNVHIGHNAELIKDGMIIVASSAVKNNNPEIIRAKELNLKIYHRSDILKMLSDEFSKRENSYFIGFSGTHGKTTTSGLCSYILEKSGMKPSYVVGGIIPDINTNAKYNSDKFFVAELDESDGTIQKYSTDIAVINNMDEDHLDYYKNGYSDIAAAFNNYLSNKNNQKVIINTDNLGCSKFKELYKDYNYITYALSNADFTAKNIVTEGFGSAFDVYKGDNFISKIELNIPGVHNIYNALAVIAALSEAGININDVKEHFSTFTGMGRRFQKTAEFNGIKIFDDYAHHPNEIKTTLNSIKCCVKDSNRIAAIFQPHRYSRLQGLWNDFKNAFDSADIVFVTNVYSAGESPIDGITSENFCKELNNNKFIYINGSIENASKEIYPYLKNNDIVITLGAGDITDMGTFLAKNSEIRV